jgi:hypothetical protein
MTDEVININEAGPQSGKAIPSVIKDLKACLALPV